MYEETFRELGLSSNEAKIYESMLGLGEVNVDLISVKSKVHRRNAYDSIAKLIEKGLVSEVFVENRKYYRAINPSRLSDILYEKQKKIETIIPELEKKFIKGATQEKAYIYKGIQGFKNYLKDIIETGEDGYFIAAKGGWFDERLKYLIPKFLKESEKKGLKHYHLFDFEMRQKMPEIFGQKNFIYKILPKEYSTTSAVDVFGDHVVTFTGLNIGKLDGDLTQFVVISRGLADSYKTWFKLVWDILPGGKFPKS
ncbi:MAG: helix-turn-helix domain-containing protein [Candidatus Micrarchaeia archaeon]